MGSIVATAVLGAIGVAWGLVSGSQMIVLDGSPCCTVSRCDFSEIAMNSTVGSPNPEIAAQWSAP